MEKTKKPLLTNIMLALLIILVFFSLYLFLKVRNLEKSKSGSLNQPTITQQKQPREIKIKKPTTNEHWRGNKNARYAWVGYSDFECPFCKKIHPDMEKLFQVESGRIAWVFRHYPLSFHPKAQKSAEATECAAELVGNDGFWQMTDLIFEKMPTMELSNLPTLASQIGLNEQSFKQCLDTGKYEKKVKDSFSEGSQAGIQATPTGVIYDLKTGKTKIVEGALPYEALKQELDDFITQDR